MRVGKEKRKMLAHTHTTYLLLYYQGNQDVMAYSASVIMKYIITGAVYY